MYCTGVGRYESTSVCVCVHLFGLFTSGWWLFIDHFRCLFLLGVLVCLISVLCLSAYSFVCCGGTLESCSVVSCS